MNPLAEVSVVLDLKQIKQHPQIEFEDDGITVKINEEMVIQEIQRQFKNKFINQKESFVIQLYDKKCIMFAYVEKITPINVKSTLSYGIIEDDDQTDVMCKSRDPKKMKIITNRLEEK